ncbi:MAG: hypothetical protein JXA99_03070 [Candidatus Lokiarchaeota archaeon]|nr:hypothetical protein [Candidatus Lokiarchaeota archaeon]
MLKEFTKQIFTRYGLTEDEIDVYLVYLRVPRATASEVFYHLEDAEGKDITFDRVIEITNKFVGNGFLKEIDGIIKRYIPLEPFFELFNTESETFRVAIADIKDRVFKDQSDRFGKLEQIQSKSITEVESAVKSQITHFFEDSDLKNKNKDTRINSSKQKFTDTEKNLEKNLHEIMNTLNSDLKNISTNFVSGNESEINKSKDDITKIVTNLLSDFSERVKNLDSELKKDLDGHVDRHKAIANDLKPKMEMILEKYLERMDKIIKELKNKISKLLGIHIDHLLNTTNNLQKDLKSKLDDRHDIISKQTTNFKETSLKIIDNLLEISNRFSDLSEDLASRGSAFKSLFLGKHKKYKARYSQVKEDILKYSKPLKKEFIKESEDFIKTNKGSTEEGKSNIENVISNENNGLASETKNLDKEAQETLNAQLENLATDLNKEIDNTLKGGIDDCSDTTVKLKDSLEKSIKTHHNQYDNAINQHKDNSLRHYTAFDTEIKKKNDGWVGDVNTKFTNANKNVTEKISGSITFWDKESIDMNKNLSEMLEDHKAKYKLNATTLQNSLSNTIKDNTQNTKDAIADFTLEFMNSIDDATEKANTTEEKLTDIFTASKKIPEISRSTTWHTVGRQALVSCIKDAIYRTKSSIIIVTPIVVPEILQTISEIAFQKKAARFMLTSHWDMNAYGGIINKMKQLGNIQFRQLSQAGEFFAVTRDAEEIILAPLTDDESELISIVSDQMQYAKLYSQFVGPIFQANSRPIK